MLICIAGDTHGQLDRLYKEVLAFEAALGARFAWVLHVGDVGIWPDVTRIDRATRNHGDVGDFPVWWAEKRHAPRPTVFVKGNHEDFVWLDEQPSTEILPGLHYLKNGSTFVLTHAGERLVVGGVGGCYGPAHFERRSQSLQGYGRRHYTRDEIDAVTQTGPLDILLLHDAPGGVPFARALRGGTTESQAVGLDRLLEQTHPRVCFFGHYHVRIDTLVAGVSCVGMNKVPYPGSLMAVELPKAEPTWRRVGEWPLDGGTSAPLHTP